MDEIKVVDLFLRFGLAGLLGLLIGLERESGTAQNPHADLRDFIMFSLLGAVSAFAAELYDNSWLIVAGFIGFLVILVIGYWIASARDMTQVIGITTEVSAILAFFIGVLVMKGALVLAIALAIVVFAILSQKTAIKRFSSSVQIFELQAALKFLVITFIVLPILPSRTLDAYFTLPIATVTSIEASTQEAQLKPTAGYAFEIGSTMDIYTDDTGHIGKVRITRVSSDTVSARYEGENFAKLRADTVVEGPIGVEFISVMLAALNPYKIWLIVVLVSLISFVGYVLIKLIGSSAGIGLTGLIGGLASSTVTTLSFAKRSKEMPAWNRGFAVAVILASSVMFPRLLLQIGIVNHALMKNMALPILVMGATGLVLAVFFFFRQQQDKPETQEVSFSNPFSLKSAISFGLVFSAILVATRLAITYLGDTWLPLVAIVSGLTDADAIAFSLSDAQQAGMISLDWASFNLVLGALSNTFMKLFLVFSLGHRGLFKHLLVAFLIIGAVGIVTVFLYYDLEAMTAAA